MAYTGPNIQTNFGQGSDFGHADYQAARNEGISNKDILAWMDANSGKLEGKNAKGDGGLYDEIVGQSKGRDYAERDFNQKNTEYGWVGNKNTFDANAAYGSDDGPKPGSRVDEAIERIDNYEAAIDSGETVQNIFGYNPKTGERGYTGDKTEGAPGSQEYVKNYTNKVKSNLKPTNPFKSLGDFSFKPKDTTINDPRFAPS